MKDTIPRIHNNYGPVNLSTGIGFSEIPEQVRQESIKNGFVFNILIVSRRGTGASTLINSLFAVPLVKKDRGDSITTTVNEIIESGIKLTLSITTYHGDDINRVFKFISTSNEEYFDMEQGMSGKFPDNRIHCCLYLVPGDKISDDEVKGLQELSTKVNVIPVITKADMFTNDELRSHRERIRNVFEGISFYKYDENDVMEFPLAVIASEQSYDEEGFRIRGRKYPWGFIDIENETYSDFKKLQRILVCEKFVDLIRKTDVVFYMSFRKTLMSNPTAMNSRARLIRILDQMEQAIEQRYEEAISECSKEVDTGELGNSINLKNEELRPISK